MKVTVFGSGYVGLTQAACLAEMGHSVCCMDVDAARIALLNEGRSPIYEPGLADLLSKNLAARRLSFTVDVAQAIAFAELIFIAVGTPSQADGQANLDNLFAVVDSIAGLATAAKIIVNKSTAPVGTVDSIKVRLAEQLGSAERAAAFQVMSNPEFLKEGSAVDDCMRPERIIIGADDAQAVEVLRDLYKPFSRHHDKFIIMDARSAELTKYAANCMLATKISFINEMANLADCLGADIEMVRRGIGSDSRIGYDFIYPGCGYGGSCFPKDIRALKQTALDVGYPSRLLQAVEAINDSQKHRLVEKISRHFNDDLTNKTFALWGLAFKPNTDDMREASSQVLLQRLWQAGARVRAYDPKAMHEAAQIFGERRDLFLASSKEEALQGADALVVVTEWSDFRVLDLDLVKARLANPVVFDGRNLFDPQQLEAAGIAYFAIGRGRRQKSAA